MYRIVPFGCLKERKKGRQKERKEKGRFCNAKRHSNNDYVHHVNEPRANT